MLLDVIIPTFNRHALLQRTLDSLLEADLPSGLDLRVTVVDNNSKDQTREVVEEYKKRFGRRLEYQFEAEQGRSAALNRGISSTDGELVGMIDDDEEIDSDWYRNIHRAFTAGDVDFIGGPYKPRWGAKPPAWLPMNYLGVIGWVDGGERVVAFDDNYPGILMGGNAVLTRAILNKVGLYKTSISRTGKRLLAGEDEDMYQRLLAAGAKGLYLPTLIIYHYIPPERLTRPYFRRWCFWRGVSRAVIDRERPSQAVYLAGVPRWLYGQAARGALRIARAAIVPRPNPAQRFSDELALWDLAGFFYGKHFYNRSQTV
ncbi:MAG TPA: glycosyltransferase [Blastocatellia bacterium]|nr:glycosyltransferase [Blastocatellia bacterium]